jgi:hypothetical protein
MAIFYSSIEHEQFLRNRNPVFMKLELSFHGTKTQFSWNKSSVLEDSSSVSMKPTNFLCFKLSFHLNPVFEL